jgi:hypothetical protein
VTKRSCSCGMFARQGICYHTGYKPTFSDDKPHDPPVPDAYRRMYAARRQEIADKRQKEKEKKGAV